MTVTNVTQEVSAGADQTISLADDAEEREDGNTYINSPELEIIVYHDFT